MATLAERIRAARRALPNQYGVLQTIDDMLEAAERDVVEVVGAVQWVVEWIDTAAVDPAAISKRSAMAGMLREALTTGLGQPGMHMGAPAPAAGPDQPEVMGYLPKRIHQLVAAALDHRWTNQITAQAEAYIVEDVTQMIAAIFDVVALLDTVPETRPVTINSTGGAATGLRVALAKALGLPARDGAHGISEDTRVRAAVLPTGPQVQAARITKTSLGFSNAGNLRAWVRVTLGDSEQEFGGWHLSTEPSWGVLTIANILKALEVDAWEQLVGTNCRVEHDRERIYAIGHPTLNRWFRPEKDLLNFGWDRVPCERRG